MTESKVAKEMQDQLSDVPGMTMRSMSAWNELLMTSADMAYDVVLKNWNYNRSIRSSVDQAVEDAIKAQHRYTNEMMQVWRGYTDDVQEIITKSMDGK